MSAAGEAGGDDGYKASDEPERVAGLLETPAGSGKVAKTAAMHRLTRNRLEHVEQGIVQGTFVSEVAGAAGALAEAQQARLRVMQAASH